jgi:hypothetical protein
MDVKLPQSIEGYFCVENTHDSALLANCFTEDAVMHDEEKVCQRPDSKNLGT